MFRRGVVKMLIIFCVQHNHVWFPLHSKFSLNTNRVEKRKNVILLLDENGEIKKWIQYKF